MLAESTSRCSAELELAKVPVSDEAALLSVAPDAWTSAGVPVAVGARLRLKLTFWVVLPAVTGADCVTEMKPVAEAVNEWLPAVSPERV